MKSVDSCFVKSSELFLFSSINLFARFLKIKTAIFAGKKLWINSNSIVEKTFYSAMEISETLAR